MKSFLYLGLSCLLVISCTAPKEQIPPVENMQQSSRKYIIYQMMTRLFGNKTSLNKKYGTAEENGVGKFNDIDNAALKGIKELGVTHVWYTGVLEHAVLTDYTAHGIPLDDADVVKGRAGSPYAIKDYYDVNPDLAVDVPNRLKEFEQLIDRTHNNGLKVLIDFVPLYPTMLRAPIVPMPNPPALLISVNAMTRPLASHLITTFTICLDNRSRFHADTIR
jgi:hypothetical protein